MFSAWIVDGEFIALSGGCLILTHIATRLHHVDLAAGRPLRWDNRNGIEAGCLGGWSGVEMWSGQGYQHITCPYACCSGRSQMAGHNQSPLGNFASTSTRPYLRLAVAEVVVKGGGRETTALI